MKAGHLLSVIVVACCVSNLAAGSTFDGWHVDRYLATYETVAPSTETGSAHLPAIVRGEVDDSAVAVIGWDIFTPERDEILLSMLLSTTWESPMEAWEGGDGWFVSSFEMPMSDASGWRLWYRDTGNGTFELGAPPFLDPGETPDYVVTDQLQREWSFTQPFLIVPEPAMGIVLMVASIGRARRREMIA